MSVLPRSFQRALLPALVALCLAGTAAAQSAVSRFVGDFSGSAEVQTYDGATAMRDMSVSVREADDGFIVKWSSTTRRDDKVKEKTYTISFVPTDRDSVYAAAMTRNVFGHEVPLDPMKGEPYVWARIHGDTLTVYSLYVTETGGYEMQQFDRTLVPEGLKLEFTALSNTSPRRTVSTILTRQ